MHPKLPALAQLADWLTAKDRDQQPVSNPQAPAGEVIDFKAVLRRFQKKAAED